MKTSLAFVCASVLFLFACAPEKYDELTGVEADSTSQADSTSEAVSTQSSDDFQGSKNQAKGFYSKGSLVNSSLIPLEGFGFVKIARPRGFGHGTHDLVSILKEAAAELQRKYPSRDRVMIADMSRDRGGSLPGHASHQNGLDADVGFIRLDQTEQDADDIGGFRELFVKNGKLTKNFDLKRNWAYAKILIETGRVQRVFVGEVIKKNFCAYAKRLGVMEQEKETLRRLRVIAGHTDHFHVRVTCPKKSTSCKEQQEVEDTTGC